MRKQSRAAGTEAKMLSDVVTISRQFLRSVRIDTDVGREDALSGYICQGTASSLLENMARQIAETRQRAFTWTGPYGGGKSSLALMLCSLVGGQPKVRAKAKQLLGFKDGSPVHKVFEAKGDGWLVVPVVGKRADVVQELSAALAKARGLPVNRKKQPDIVGELIEAAERHPQGVLVVIDELGKLLEASAQDGGDIYFFQELAEAASRCSGKLVIVGILHQAFEAYASRLGRQSRDEWAKVQGRFVDIPLVAAADEVIELVGKAITVEDPSFPGEASKLADTIAAAIRNRRPGTPATLADSLRACWPLHPVTAALLGPISRRRFGQNERSTFGFLASREPLGFVEFLNGYEAQWFTMYGPAAYWDYLRANLEPAIVASPDGHRWAQCCDAVERAEAKGTDVHVKLTKTIALIEMFRNGSGLVAEGPVLAVSTPSVDEEQIRKALEELADWKVLIERKHLGAWGIYAGSDFDIEAAINLARGEIGEPDLEHISTLSDLQPVLAKRHYQKTGTMRWFTRGILRLDGIESVVEHFELKGASAGAFLLCLPPPGQTVRSAEHRVRHTSAATRIKTLLLGTPKNAERIIELSLELSASQRVMKTRPELHGDSVARREVIGRIEAIRASLEEELADAFELSKWYSQGAAIETKGSTVLSVIASDIAEEVYEKAPHIFSELINREDPSSNSVKARKDLMNRMVTHAHLPKLGYEGFPADAGLYYTVLNDPGLHRSRGDDGWNFGDPNFNSRGTSYENFWWQTNHELLTEGKSLTLEELYTDWARPPFGIRAGVMPVLSLAFYLANRSSLALYVNGVFTPDLTDAVVDEWTLDPGRIRFQHVEASRDKAKLVNALAKTISERSNTEVGAAPLDVARGLVGLVVGLPGWTKRTTTVSSRAQQVRAMLLKASDPLRVLFSDLPTLLEAQDPATLNARLQAVTDELSGAYHRMLTSVRVHLMEALDHGERPLEDLRQRATTVKGMSGDFKLDAFATRLETYDESDETVESLISLTIDKPQAAWVDRDIDAAMAKLAEWAVDFRKAETMAPLRGRPSTRRVIGVVFGASHGQDVTGFVDISESDTPAIDRLVKQFLAEAQGERKEVILAALAEAGAMMVKQQSKGKKNG
ncbi:ATP-binding protein [Variovorax saccharolyticus]|uniref:ATP-binding protein n=1 Tax=Variovorax saccharolyticus TaxID=3053516 RepID=UPI002577C834|nr:ATP-binding protein [Variovorax sp. J22R187]MDM0018011.1 ATP-binding protein [Variovorax sp. J22R187]